MASKYNIQTIQFLIASFNSIIGAMGKTDTAVKFYKEQVNNLQTVSQIQYSDIDMVYRILGMRNTNAVKWDITTARLKKFTDAMNYMICCKTDEQRKECLDQLRDSGKVDTTVYGYIVEIYEIKETPKKTLDTFKTSEFGRFGQFDCNVKKKPSDSANKDKGQGYAEKIGERVKKTDVSSIEKDIKNITKQKDAPAVTQRYIEDIAKGFLRLKNLSSSDPLEDVLSDSYIRKQFVQFLLSLPLKEVFKLTQDGDLCRLRNKGYQDRLNAAILEYWMPQSQTVCGDKQIFERACNLYQSLSNQKVGEDIRLLKGSYDMIYRYPNLQAVCKCDPTVLYKKLSDICSDKYLYKEFLHLLESEERNRIEIGNMVSYQFIADHRVQAALIDNIKIFKQILCAIDIMKSQAEDF